MSLTFYSPTFIDESMTCPTKHCAQRPTGNLSGMVFARTFSRHPKSKRIKATRGIISFSWSEDTQDAKATALAKAIEGMEELPELDSNPELNWIPAIVKEKLP